MKTLLLLCLALVLATIQTNADQRHWVGSGSGSNGRWSVASNWSATAGGSGGAGVPTSTSDVFIDKNTSCNLYTAGSTCNSLTISTGSLSFASYGLTVGAGGVVISGGTLNISTGSLSVAGSWSHNGGTFTPNGRTVTFNGSSQSISSETFDGLTFSVAGTKSVNGNLVVNGTLNLASGVTLDMSIFTLTGTLGTISNSGTITTSNTSSTPIPISKIWGGTVNYTGISGQTISSGTYTNLNINNAAAAGAKLGGATTITSLTIGDVTAYSIFNDGGFLITPGASSVLTVSNSGTYNLGSNTVGTNWPSWGTRNLASGTTVGYVSGVTQAVSTTPAYQNLTFSGAGTKTPPAGTLSVGGNWSVTGGTAALNTNNTNVTVTGDITSGNITSGSGTISVGGTWTNSGTFTCGTGTVNFTGGSQTIPSLTYYTLTLSGSGTKTAAGNISTTTLNNTVGAILDMVGYTLTATTINNGSSTIKFNGGSNGKAISTGTVEYYGTTQNVATGTYSTLTLSASGTKTSGGNLTAATLNNQNGSILDMVGNTLSVSGSIDNTGSTIKFNGTNGLAISTGIVEYYGTIQNVASGTYSNLIISASGVKTAGGNLTAATLNNKNGSILDMAGNTLSVSGTIDNTGSTIKFNGTNGLAIPTGTVEYYGTTQTLASGNYDNLTLTVNGTSKTLSGAITVAGSLTINSGVTLNAGSNTITITGPGLAWNNSGIFNFGFSTVKMQGTLGQSMFGSTFYNLEINNSSGVTLTSSDFITNQLTLTSGNLSLGDYNLTLISPATISGAASSKYIITNGLGTLIQNVGSSPVTFPIGLVVSDYTPITFSNSGAPQNFNVSIESVTPSLVTDALYKRWIVKETNAGSTILGSVTLAWNNNLSSMGTLGAPINCDMVANTTGSVDLYDPIKKLLNGSTYSVSTGSIVYPLPDITTGLYITVVGDVSGLPVELSSFTSAVNGRDVSLDWKTMTEKNSNKFEIERSVNQNWTNVGTVKAAVLSNSPKQYSFTDKNLQTGKYQYRLKMIDNDGTFAYSKVTEAVVSTPKSFELSQNYPNPFNPSTRIGYQLPVDSKVTLEVYNIVGQRVAMIVNEEQSAGYYTVNFNSTSYRNITSGVYIYKLTAVDNAGKNSSSIKKMMLLK